MSKFQEDMDRDVFECGLREKQREEAMKQPNGWEGIRDNICELTCKISYENCRARYKGEKFTGEESSEGILKACHHFYGVLTLKRKIEKHFKSEYDKRILDRHEIVNIMHQFKFLHNLDFNERKLFAIAIHDEQKRRFDGKA